MAGFSPGFFGSKWTKWWKQIGQGSFGDQKPRQAARWNWKTSSSSEKSMPYSLPTLRLALCSSIPRAECLHFLSCIDHSSAPKQLFGAIDCTLMECYVVYMCCQLGCYVVYDSCSPIGLRRNFHFSLRMIVRHLPYVFLEWFEWTIVE